MGHYFSGTTATGYTVCIYIYAENRNIEHECLNFKHRMKTRSRYREKRMPNIRYNGFSCIDWKVLKMICSFLQTHMWLNCSALTKLTHTLFVSIQFDWVQLNHFLSEQNLFSFLRKLKEGVKNVQLHFSWKFLTLWDGYT